MFHQPRIIIEHTVAEDIEAERHRVYSAFDKMREQIDNMAREAEFGTGGEHQEMLETYKMFAYDEGWSRRINEAIDCGLTAEAAIERVQQRTRMRMREIDDPLLQDRMHDLEDLSNRLLRIVSGQMGTAAQTGLRHDTVLIARNLGPAELLEYDRRRLKGVMLEEGSLTAHVTIVARAMGVPVIGRVRDVRHSVEEGETDPRRRRQRKRDRPPDRGAARGFEQRMALSQKRRAEFAAVQDAPARRPRDGVQVSVMVNAGLRDDVAALADDRRRRDRPVPHRIPVPRLGDAAAARAPAAALQRGARSGGRQAGRLPHRRHRRRQGAALSHRRRRGAGRESGDGLARAAPRARPLDADEGAGARADRGGGAGKVLQVMFPMVSEPWEFDEARALFEEQVDWARKAHASCPSAIHYGAMLEVPASPKCSTCCCPRVDFLSIGTNDLTQFLFAADRADPAPRPALRLAEPGDPALPQARARCSATRPECRRGSAARWRAGRSRRWR